MGLGHRNPKSSVTLYIHEYQNWKMLNVEMVSPTLSCIDDLLFTLRYPSPVRDDILVETEYQVSWDDS